MAPRSVAYLFVLLMLSFEKEKAFIFMRTMFLFYDVCFSVSVSLPTPRS